MTRFTPAEFAEFFYLHESVPLHLGSSTDRHFVEGYSIHRNNVLASPVEALRQAFPAVQRLLGKEYFTALCQHYIALHPPRSAVYHEYGGSLSDFIATFPPLQNLPYLADVARLEWARLCAFHAGDGLPLRVDPGCIESLTGILSQPVCWHPSVTLIYSEHPLFSLWQSQIDISAPPSRAEWYSDIVLVWRQGITLRTERVTQHTASLMEGLKAGVRLSDQLENGEVQADTLIESFALLLEWQILQAVSPATLPQHD